MDNAATRKKRRIVVKVGTSTLTHENGRANLQRIDGLARALSDAANMGNEIVLVSSGAVGVGMGKLKINSRPSSTAERQAIASVGQCELMQLYSKLFGEYGHTVGQILLTRGVVDAPASRQNAINTLETLISMGIVPIVNENDTVSTEELESSGGNGFGDNDTLSVIVADLVGADLLVILSDIDGLYTENPRHNPNAVLLRRVSRITDEIAQAAGGVGSSRGTGGMAAKIDAARIALEHGIDLVLANGANPSIIYDILGGNDVGTLFKRP